MVGLGSHVTGLNPSLTLLLKALTLDPSHPEEDRRRLLRASILPLVVQEIRVRDAGPFLQLVVLPFAGPGLPVQVQRVLPNRLAVQKVADAADIIALLLDPLLPRLLLSPTDASDLRVVDACSSNLRESARLAGGSFGHACTDFAQRLTSFTADARAHTMFAPYAPLRARIDDLTCRAKRFLASTHTLRLPDAAEAAAAVAAAAEAAAAVVAAVEDGEAKVDAGQI